MPTENPHEPYTIPELTRGLEPDTPPGAGGDAVPPQVPGYEITGELARGGMGVVYAARDLTLNREVAVKTILPRLSADPRYAAQFDREARLTAMLQHPGVPPIHARGTLADGRPFLAMKLIKGRTLVDTFAAADGMADRLRLLGVFEAICQTVGYAHSVGIIHRDLKPSNVMVGAFGEVQVMDWGLAKVTSREREWVGPETHHPNSRGGGSIDGEAKGTPAYMPPEQACGQWDRVDARSDVFALGAILFQLLTGQPPYTGANAREVLRKAERCDAKEAFARLSGCGADAELIAICKRCLSPSPTDRPSGGKAVASAVMAYRAGTEDRARQAEFDKLVANVKDSNKEKWKTARVQVVGLLVILIVVAAYRGGTRRDPQPVLKLNPEPNRSQVDPQALNHLGVFAEQPKVVEIKWSQDPVRPSSAGRDSDAVAGTGTLMPRTPSAAKAAVTPPGDSIGAFLAPKAAVVPDAKKVSSPTEPGRRP